MEDGENDPVVRQTVLCRERERERDRENEKGEMKERKGVWGARVAPKRPTVCNDWLQACSERVREGGGGRGLTCSGVSSIAAQTQP